MERQRIAVAGCGRMGLGMCRALVDAGFDALGFDIRPAGEFGDFARHMRFDPDEIRAHAEVLFTVVRDMAETEALLFEDQALAVDNPVLKTLVISSTLSPRDLARIGARAPRNVTLIDAPMSGSQIAAEERRLSFMLGGPAEALDRLQPALDAMGARFHRMGPFGAGMATKVLNNFVAVSSVAAVRRSLGWADELGLDREALLAVMHDSSGQTWFGSNFDVIEFARHGYDRGNTVGILAKDVEAALDGVGAPDDPLGRAVIDAIRALRPLPEG